MKAQAEIGFEKNGSAAVLLSGGQDSTTCLYWAMQNFEHVTALTFDYGQRHRSEIEAAHRIAMHANIPWIGAKVVLPEFIPSALTNTMDTPISSQHPNAPQLPASFVPGRNIILMTLAAAWCWSQKPKVNCLVSGVCETDYSGYPDCRSITVQAVRQAIRLGLDFDSFHIITPLMFLSKRESVELASELPGCMEALALSQTCYEGKRPPCGTCPACKIRARGFEEAGIKDPIYV